jgi:large subunit ribosomal protein L24e
MVVKTERCAFSEFLVFPGHGMKFIRRDGQPLMLGSSKAKSLYMQRLKPAKLTWTQGWRRLNKKALVDTIAKKRTRKNTKVTRAIVGVSLDEVIILLFSFL